MGSLGLSTPWSDLAELTNTWELLSALQGTVAQIWNARWSTVGSVTWGVFVLETRGRRNKCMLVRVEFEMQFSGS